MRKKPPPTKPTQTFGTFNFGKDGSVTGDFSRLPDIKEGQEAKIAESFAAALARRTDSACEVRPLPEADHDFELLLREQRITVQATEIVPIRDYLVQITDEGWSEGELPFNEFVYDGVRNWGVDQEKRARVLQGKLELKLSKHYAQVGAPMWLLLWTVDSSLMTDWWQNGQHNISAAVIRLRERAESGIDPFSEIWFHNPVGQTARLWPA